MAATSGLLSQYLDIKRQIIYYQKESIKYNNLMTANEKKVGEQTKAEEKFESQYDCAEECFNDPTKELKLNGTVVLEKGEKGTPISQRFKATSGLTISGGKEGFASSFASKKIPKYDPELLEEYTDLDMNFSMMVGEVDTILEALKAEKDTLEPIVKESAADTNMNSGG